MRLFQFSENHSLVDDTTLQTEAIATVHAVLELRATIEA